MDQSSRRLNCPWCNSHQTSFLLHEDNRDYHECSNCDLIFVPRSQILSPTEEYKRYLHHENNLNDSAYINYFNKMLEPCSQFLKTPKMILDFGCGPSKVLEHLLKPLGHQVSSFDLYFFPELSLLNKSFDLIFVIEAIEHFREPQVEIEKLKKCLNPSGRIIVKTKLLPEKDKFKEWYYKKDLTHIQFFTAKTLANHDEIFSISN